MSQSSEYPNALPIGSRVFYTQNHKYRIDGVLGQGGFGITYLATCLQDFTPAYRHGEVIAKDTKLAIKECFPQKFAVREGNAVVANDNPDSVQKLYEYSVQFLQEGRTLAHFAAVSESDSIVPIYHCGRIAHANITFFVMPYLEGGPLTSWARRLSPAQVADILYQLLDALAFCHGQDEPLLHLDIKPDNIMLTRKNGRLIPVLIDFGLSQRKNGPAALEMGGFTIGYAPWEQADRKHWRDIAPWTDVYALGATMYSIITGKRPPSHKERPTLLDYGEEDPYEPLHTRPELVEAFSAVNPEDGERLLWSIDVALNPNMEDESEIQGVTIPRRWEDANEWMSAAFPDGPWHLSDDDDDDDDDDGEEKKKGGAISRKLIALLVVALLALVAVLVYLFVLRPSGSETWVNVQTASSGTEAVADNAAQGESTETPSPELATTEEMSPADESRPAAPAWGASSAQARSDDSIPADLVPRSEFTSAPAKESAPSVPAAVEVADDGRLVMVNAKDEGVVLQQWQSWAELTPAGGFKFESVYAQAENKVQVMLQFIYAWQHTSAYPSDGPNKSSLAMILNDVVGKEEFSSSVDLKAVKAFYQNCAGKSDWLDTFLTVQGNPTDENAARLMPVLNKNARAEMKSRLSSLQYEWDGSKLTCSAENKALASKLVELCGKVWPGGSSWMEQEDDDMAKATMLVALSLTSETNERSAELRAFSEATPAQPHFLLMSCYHHFRAGSPWAEAFSASFVQGSAQTDTRFEGMRQYLYEEHVRQLVALVTGKNQTVSPQQAEQLRAVFNKLPSVEEKSKFLTQLVEKLDVLSLRTIFTTDKTTASALQKIQQCMLKESEWQKTKKRTDKTRKEHATMLKEWKNAVEQLSDGIAGWYAARRTSYDACIGLLASSPEACRGMDEQHRMQTLVLMVANVISTNAQENSPVCRFINATYGESPDSYGKTLESLPALFIKAHTYADSEKTKRARCHEKIVGLLNGLPWQERGYREWLDILACLFNAVHR